MLRVIAELKWWELRRGTVREECAAPELADDAETFKGGMGRLAPDEMRGWNGALRRNPVFWGRIALHHLRTPSGRRWTLVVRTLDGAHRMLLLQVPPLVFVSDEERLEHASRQWTYHDDVRGRFAKGLRVADEFMQLLEPQDQDLAREYLSGGHPMKLVSASIVIFFVSPPVD